MLSIYNVLLFCIDTLFIRRFYTHTKKLCLKFILFLVVIIIVGWHQATDRWL